MLRLLTILCCVLAAIAGLSFSSLNAQPVTVHYFLDVGRFPLSVVVVVAFSMGCLVALLVSALALIRFRHDRRKVQREFRRVERELNNLRNAPIKDLE